MKRLIARYVLIVSLATATCPAMANAHEHEPPWMTRWLRDQLRTSHVPVLLPTPPREVGPIRAVSLIDIGRDGYEVGYSTVPHCGGARSCATFFVSGTPAHDGPALPTRYHRIRLDDGTRAHYAANDCSGASCTGGSLIVELNGVDYELDGRLADDDFLILQRAYHTLRLWR